MTNFLVNFLFFQLFHHEFCHPSLQEFLRIFVNELEWFQFLNMAILPTAQTIDLYLFFMITESLSIMHEYETILFWNFGWEISHALAKLNEHIKMHMDQQDYVYDLIDLRKS